MTDTQPAALRLADQLDAVPETGADPQTIQDAAAELRRLHAYCQELESQVIFDCMTHIQNHAENEHVAGDVSKNGAESNMSAQQEAQEPCPTCAALARTVMLDQVSFDRKPDCYGIRQITDDEGVEEWEDIRTSPDVAREEANDMMATGRGEIYEVVPLWTTPKPSPAAQGDALDADLTDSWSAIYAAPKAVPVAQTAPAPGERCQHCIDRHDGVYGSWAAPCPYHDDDGKPRPTANAAPQQEAQEPFGWCVTGCGRLLDEHEAKTEAKHIGGTARAIPLYTAPQPSPTAQAAESVQDMQSVNDAVTIELPPLPDPDLRDVGTTPGGIKEFLRGYATEYAKAALAARAPAYSVLEDAARLDWLEQNLFHREKDEWDTKFGGYKEYNMWVLFSPKGIQGSARNIIDAAREQGADHDR